jgi:hypothetical protein
MTRPLGVFVLIVLELFIGILGIASGLNLLADPSGRGLGLDIIIDKIPLNDFILLGIWFLFAYGAFPILLSLGFWNKWSWSWMGALILAIIELVWVIGQIYFVGVNILQAVIGVIALMTIYSLYRPTVKIYFNRQE